MWQLEFWHWWALALCFVVIEALIPSGVFAALAIAGGVIGAMFLYDPDFTWQAQLGGFGAITMVMSYPLTYIYRRKLGGHNSVAHAASGIMGKELELTMPIQNGFGEITIDGTTWELKGPELKKGSRVRVIGLDGNMLVIRPINSTPKNDQPPV